MALVTKILTHDFESENEEVYNFDTYIGDYREKDTFSYTTKATFSKNSVTNLNILARNYGDTKINPVLDGLLGYSLGNQSLSLLTIEVERQTDLSTGGLFDNIHLQVYNPTDVDISSDVKIQFKYDRRVLYPKS